MKHFFRNPERGSLILVALCFVAVLGIALASYLAVSNQSTKLSNRSFQTGLSEQLAEMGLEEALRAFNQNDWNNWSINPPNVSSGAWISDPNNSHRVTRTINFLSGKFGQGVTGTVRMRIDNFDATQLTSEWNNSASYKVNDLVSYTDGMWYRCIQNPSSNQAPGNLAYWAQAPIPWQWSGDITYSQYDVVNYNGTWYRYFSGTAGSGNLPTDTTHWNTIPALSLAWITSTTYPRGALVFYSGDWYYCYSAHTSSTTPDVDTTHWVTLTTTTNTWDSSANYVVGDFVYQGGWYRCISNHSNHSPPNAYWASTTATGRFPYFSWAWRSGVAYEFNDVVFYSGSGSGTWYRCKTAGASTPTSG